MFSKNARVDTRFRREWCNLHNVLGTFLSHAGSRRFGYRCGETLGFSSAKRWAVYFDNILCLRDGEVKHLFAPGNYGMVYNMSVKPPKKTAATCVGTSSLLFASKLEARFSCLVIEGLCTYSGW